MTSPLLPPNPCLVAILLVVNYHHKPRIAFHYPPKPGEDNAHFKNSLSSEFTDEEVPTSSDEESASSTNDQATASDPAVGKSKDADLRDGDLEEAGSASPEKVEGVPSMQRSPQWDDVFGYRALYLAKLLCPPASSHKRRFEMSLNEKAFLGWPVFAKDGKWRPRRRAKRSKSRDQLPGGSSREKGEQRAIGGKTSLQVAEELEDTSEQVTDVDGQNKLQDTETGSVADITASLEDSKLKLDNIPGDIPKQKKAKDDFAKDTLKMFHVVFVLDPPPLEYHLRMKEMYDHVVKKFSRALKWEQARSNYVSKEASNIAIGCKNSSRLGGKPSYLSELKGVADDEKGIDNSLATMYHQILSQSSLAKAISTLFNSISNSKIAHINLSPASSLSLQIPIPTSTSVLPSPIAPQLPGLWLTTAASLPTDDDMNTTSSQLAHFALLLLSDLSSILSDISATASPLTEPLTHYLRVSKPTKSILQISQSSGIALPVMQILASHLIYWRRARAIPPLHQRDTYIVSPNADMRKLAPAISAFAKRFPGLPSLPRILNMLSFTPRAYATIIPRKDLKETYLDCLAWLLRNGWVTQLRTFAWVRVPIHIKESVAKQRDHEPPLSPPNPTSSTPNSSANTNNNNNNKKPTAPPRSPSPPSPTSNSNPTPHLFSPPTPSLIPNPRHASGLPSRHLSAISAHIRAEQGVETHAAWEACVRYFDGHYALETIAVVLGWKRKRVVDLVAGWERLGVLVRGRHW